MAPRAGGRRTATASPQAVRRFGVEGRKTGVVLPENATVDEYGMQRLSDIFSSPRKSRGSSSARSNRTRDDESEPMDIASSPGPGPQTVLKGRHLPIPRSKSPVKTNLKSPARRGPARDRLPSSDDNATVTRRIDFGNAISAGPKRGQPSRANGINGALHEESEEDEDVDPVEFGDHPPTDDIINRSLQMAEEMGEYSDEDPPIVGDEPESDAELFPTRTGSGKKGKQRRPFPEPADNDEDPEDEEGSDPEPEAELPPPRRPGRPPKKDSKAQEPAKARGSKKRQSMPEDEEQTQAKRQKTTAASAKSAKGKVAATAKPANKPGRPKGRPKKLQQIAEEEEVGDTSMAALQRGPPMPKARGLVSVRHEEGMKQTRSGRHSFKPLAFWRGEATVAEREDYDDMFQKDRHFVLPSVKEVVRVAADVAPSKRAPRSKSRAKTKSKSTAAQEEDEELEEWETKPGTMTGEVVIWEPEHELHPPAEDEPVHIAEEQIAISGDAVQTRDIRDATFRFAKTLTMPFMGAGIVDLPPGAEKRPKNSRKMHMAFFVHYGKVMVTVNEAQFRISPGGTWFVPRGNYYSITNDYDNPARIFFAQACEVPAQPVELEEE